MRARTPLLAVCGTRPEVIKIAPVVKSLRALGHRVILVITGQHPDLAPQMLAEAGLTPDVDLAVHQPGNSPAQLLAGILTHLSPIISAWRPMMILVQGDTVSALAGALAANYARVPVAHIEAGLRTNDRDEPFPEEMHRCVIAPLAALHFAPTRNAVLALEREGVDPATIHLTGNTAIDAVLATASRLDAEPEFADNIARHLPFRLNSDRPLLLATVHRRENIGARMSSIAAGIARLAGFCEMEAVLPLHPNPAVRELLRARLAGLEGVHLIPPVDHTMMVWLMRRAQLLLTDSGGLQEEAPALGLRTLVLRTATERPEGIAAGATALVGLTADAIVQAVRASLQKPKLTPVFPFGDGQAAPRIASILHQWLGFDTNRTHHQPDHASPAVNGKTLTP